MSIMDNLNNSTSFSFEVFPPKTDKGMSNLASVLQRLNTMRPDYISCTYGAGGSNVGKNLEVLNMISTLGNVEPVTHFTCIGNTKEDIKEKLQTYLDNGINNILALRGDLPYGWTGTNGDLHYATELVKFITDEFPNKFTIAVAGSPEGHVECTSLEADINFLKEKQDNGANYIITQLCWDMNQFRRWLDKIRDAGITMPVDAGIMPITTITGTLTNALSHNACVMDRKLCEIITKYWLFPNPYAPEDAMAEQKKEDFHKAGLDYTVDLVKEYQSCGVNGIHLYALNKYEDVHYIAENAGLIK